MASDDTPSSVLFVCNMNQIRSPMAEFLTRDIYGSKIYAQSAGIYVGDRDEFMHSVMQERKIDSTSHEPESLEQLDVAFVDLIIPMTRQANDACEEFFRGHPVRIEFWDTENPSIAVGNREAVLASYRKTRNDLEKQIRKRFG